MQGHSRIASTARGPRIAVGCALLLTLVAAPRAASPNKACALAAPDELEALLGAGISRLQGSEPTPGLAMCTGQNAGVSVMLRVAQKRGSESDEAANRGIEMMRKMGAKVEVQSFGEVTCSTMVPPPNLAQHGYNTTCSLTRGGDVAAIEVTAKAQKDMVSIDALRALAEKFADRF